MKFVNKICKSILEKVRSSKYVFAKLTYRTVPYSRTVLMLSLKYLVFVSILYVIVTHDVSIGAFLNDNLVNEVFLTPNV